MIHMERSMRDVRDVEQTRRLTKAVGAANVCICCRTTILPVANFLLFRFLVASSSLLMCGLLVTFGAALIPSSSPPFGSLISQQRFSHRALYLCKQHQCTSNENEQIIGFLERRRYLLETLQTATAAAGLAWIPETAHAVTPITTRDTSSVAAQAIRYFRPKPVQLLRNKLTLEFAVLLMRTSYQVTDEIDVVAMNQFQRDFFLIRSAEYETYLNDLGGPGLVTQGDLQDAYYFDFISFAQYLTISRAVSANPIPAIFEEQQAIDRGEDVPNEFVTRVVRRDSSLLTKEQLIPEFDRRVGLAILQKLDEKLAGTPLALPLTGNRPDIDEIMVALTQLTKLFLLNGFAMDGKAELVAPPPLSGDATGSTIRLTLFSPANLWSGQSLQFQKAALQNDFLRKTAVQLLNRLGYRVSSFTVKYEANKEITSMTLQ